MNPSGQVILTPENQKDLVEIKIFNKERKRHYMKRSEINTIIEEAMEFIKEYKFVLPPFAYFGREQWENTDKEYDEICDNMLGWDITDFGSGDYEKIGLLMFTIRNGNLNDTRYLKPYAEKLLIAKPGQVTPYHFHYNKMEDIINRGGGNLIVKMYEKTEDEKLDNEKKVLASVDGRNYYVEPGEEIIIMPGESITIYPGQYHSFWGETGNKAVLVGEVSKVNDDTVDNRFLEKTGRFPAIEEDQPAKYLLYTDYMRKQV